MTREREIEILMMDRCTKSEAEEHLKNGTIIYEDFEENFDKYMKEWETVYVEDSEDYIELVEDMRRMVESGIPVKDWGIVKDEGKTYYIEYCL